MRITGKERGRARASIVSCVAVRFVEASKGSYVRRKEKKRLQGERCMQVGNGAKAPELWHIFVRKVGIVSHAEDSHLCSWRNCILFLCHVGQALHALRLAVLDVMVRNALRKFGPKITSISRTSLLCKYHAYRIDCRSSPWDW